MWGSWEMRVTPSRRGQAERTLVRVCTARAIAAFVFQLGLEASVSPYREMDVNGISAVLMGFKRRVC